MDLSVISRLGRYVTRPVRIAGVICAAAIIGTNAFAYDEMASYPGGDEALMRDVASALVYPAEALEAGREGRVIVNFVIDTLGRISEPRVLRGVSPELDSAAMDAVMKLKPFIPGKRDGRPLRVSYTVPVRFKINVPAETAAAPQPPVAPAAVNKAEGDYHIIESDTVPVYPGGQVAMTHDLMRDIGYPDELLKRGVQGSVLVTFTVDTSGKVRKAKILKGVDRLLDSYVISAVKHLKRFKPAMKDGVPVDYVFTFPINFGIREVNDPSNLNDVLSDIAKMHKEKNNSKR